MHQVHISYIHYLNIPSQIITLTHHFSHSSFLLHTSHHFITHTSNTNENVNVKNTIRYIFYKWDIHTNFTSWSWNNKSYYIINQISTYLIQIKRKIQIIKVKPNLSWSWSSQPILIFLSPNFLIMDPCISTKEGGQQERKKESK